MKATKDAATVVDPSVLIDARIESLDDWRGETLARMRKLIHEALPDVVETWKWMGTPVWEHGGILCTGESYKDKVKLTFAKGASLPDPGKLFNSSLDGNARRALDIFEGEKVDATKFKALIKAAAALNATKKPATKKASATKATLKKAAPKKVAPRKTDTKKAATKKVTTKSTRKAPL